MILSARALWGLALAAGLCLAFLPPEAQAGRGTPSVRPCFVPPHPLKHGIQPPLEPPSSPRALVPPPPGDPEMAYHADRLGLTGVAAPPVLVRKAIVLLVDFEEQEMGTAFADQKPDSIQLYFDRVMTFVHQMYDQMSDGQLQLECTIAPRVYRLPESLLYYGLDDSIATREAELCRDAVEAADADIDFSQYETFFVFHAGPGQEADIYNNSKELIWSVFFRQIDFQYWLQAPDAEFGIRTNDPAPGGGPFYVHSMVVVPETESQDGFEFGILGVVAHEFGHRFGLPDLYDTTGPEDFIYADSQGIGTFGLMGAGIWNANGFFPAEMDAWCKFYVGWLRPRVVRPDEPVGPSGVGGEQRVSLAAVENDRRGGAVRIPMGGDEYFLIENRVRDYNGDGKFNFADADSDGVFDFWTDSYEGAEFDWELPRPLSGSGVGGDGSGLLIWHVDESVIRDLLLYNLVNADALHKGVDLEEADGIQDLDKLEFQFEAFGDFRDSYWAPNATEITPNSVPPSDGYNDALTQVWITDISVPGPTMSFRVRFTSPQGGQRGDFKPGWPIDLPGLTRDFQPVAGNLDGIGEQEIALGVTRDDGMGGVILLRPDGTSYPGGGPPRVLAWGALRSEPILVNIDTTDPLPEILWVSGDTLYAAKGNGNFLGRSGEVVPSPVPFYLLAADHGRVYLSAADVDGYDQGRPEILLRDVSRVLGLPDGDELLVVAYRPGTGTRRMLSVPLPGLPGTSITLPHVAAEIDTLNLKQKELVSSVRTLAGGYLQVALTEVTAGDPAVSEVLRYSFADTVAFSAPVVGDLDRDGRDEIVVTDSRGFLHVLSVNLHFSGASAPAGTASAGPVIVDAGRFSELPGWPVQIGSLPDDEPSLADVDGDGFLEVLAFGPENTFYVFNYNGTKILTLPVKVPAENRYTAPLMAPFALDVTGDGKQDILLPLADGQIRGHDTRGRPLSDWVYLGGGNQRSYPLVVDLDGDGSLELFTLEDVSIAVPADAPIRTGDESGLLVKTGRALLRQVGLGTGEGDWPVYRHDAARSGRAVTPDRAVGEPEAGGLLGQSFVMPNPVRGAGAAFHYEVRSNVQRVTIDIIDAAGRDVRRLTGSIYPGTDNLVRWDLANEGGRSVAPGFYLARFQAEAGSQVEVRMSPFVVLR